MAKRKAPKTAFKRGQSGNPGGRPKSAAAYLTAVMEACPRDKWQSILSKVVELADGGEQWAVQWLGRYLQPEASTLRAMYPDDATTESGDLLQRLKDFFRPNDA
jgi:hypothetical protein